MQGDKHVHVNSGLLNIIKTSFEKRKIDVFCDEIHKNELLKYIEISTFFTFNTFSYTGTGELRKIAIPRKTFRETLLAYKVFRHAKRNNAELIVFASAFPFTALFLNFFSWYFNQKIIVGLHGDIGVLSLNRIKLTTIVYKYVVSLFFRTRGVNTIALFYGQTIKDMLFKKYPEFDKNNIICIDHPYNYDYKLDSVGHNAKEEKCITIANIGTGLMNKNSHLLYELAKLQKDNIVENKVRFIQVGNVSPEVMSYSNDYVEIINNNEFIPFDIFEKNILEADYFVYFFQKNTLYDLCPSGTFFDAIKCRKPILSLRNPFFEYYFKKLGNIGYLCDSVVEMNRVINDIVSGADKEEYLVQTTFLAQATQLLSTNEIQKSFIEQYNTIQ